MIYIVGAVDGGGARAVVTSTGDYRWPDNGVFDAEEEEEPYLNQMYVHVCTCMYVYIHSCLYDALPIGAKGGHRVNEGVSVKRTLHLYPCTLLVCTYLPRISNPLRI
jgi:hypothetical protein